MWTLTLEEASKYLLVKKVKKVTKVNYIKLA